MKQVDFTGDLYLFASPWCEDKLEDARYTDALALAWVALWNYTIDRTSMEKRQLHRICEGLFDIPIEQLTDVLYERKIAFFPDDNRLIERYRVVSSSDDFSITVVFVEPNG